MTSRENWEKPIRRKENPNGVGHNISFWHINLHCTPFSAYSYLITSFQHIPEQLKYYQHYVSVEWRHLVPLDAFPKYQFQPIWEKFRNHFVNTVPQTNRYEVGNMLRSFDFRDWKKMAWFHWVNIRRVVKKRRIAESNSSITIGTLHLFILLITHSISSIEGMAIIMRFFSPEKHQSKWIVVPNSL